MSHYLVLANSLAMTALAGSLLTLGWLARRHRAGLPLVELEPRTPVPWSAAAAIAVIAIIALGLFARPVLEAVDPAGETRPASGAVAVMAVTDEVPDIAPNELTGDAPGQEGLTSTTVWGIAGQYILMALTCHALLIALWRATPFDLGWPANWNQARRDAVIGATTALAMLAPVYAVQFALVSLLEQPEEHALLRGMKEEPSTSMMAAIAMAAVVSAPLFEETAFRLIIQGWLERASSLLRHTLPQIDVVNDSALAAVIDPVQPVVNVEPVVEVERVEQVAPVERVAWTPIAVSSVLFASAHIGQNVAPISLLPLALALGYVYQRTHRLLPSVVCHAAFNGFSMLLAWLAVKGGSV